MTQRVEVDADRRERIAEGIALRLDGATYQAAADAVNIPRSSLQLWVHKLASDPGALKPVEDRIVATAAACAQRGFERIYDEIDAMDHGKLIAATGMSADKLGAYRGWGRRSDAADIAGAVADRISALEGKVSLSVTFERTSGSTGSGGGSGGGNGSSDRSEPSSVTIGSKPSDSERQEPNSGPSRS